MNLVKTLPSFMRKIRVQLYLFFLFLVPLCAWSQTGKIEIFTHPPEAKVLVDGQAIAPSGRVLELPAGPHRIEVWSPTWTYVDSTVVVLPDTLISYFGRCKRDSVYHAYRKGVRRYKWTKAKVAGGIIFVPATVALGVVLDRTARREMADAKHLAERRREEYYREVLPERIAYSRDQFNIARRTYTNNLALRWVNGGVGLAVIGGSTWMAIRNLKKLRNSSLPVYQQENPFARIEWNMGTGPQGAWVSGFTLKF